MGWRDRAAQAREFAEGRIGVAVRPTEEVARLEENEQHYRQLRLEASELGLHAMSFLAGRPVEVAYEKRHRLAQRARVAFLQDPLAGREVEMLSDFALGRGVSIPEADDEEVQGVIREAWTDPKNEEVLTGFDAQRALVADLKTQANIFVAGYAKGGYFRVTMLDADTISDVVPDPEDELRPLYYLGRRRVFKWDVDHDRPAFEDGYTEEGKPKVTYYPHWRNLEAAKREREEDSTLEALPSIPDEKAAPGDPLVYHCRINRLGRMHFGVPPFARSLRFYSAMNQFTEARVSMAQAAASFVARRVVKGGKNAMMRAAGAVLAQTGELATQQFPSEEDQLAGTSGQYRRPPIPEGSVWAGNEADQIESLNLRSGGSEAMADAQIIRAPIAASSGFGQHYLGDASNANLATATTLELPTLMMTLAMQELIEQLDRWFTDMAIETAVRSGRLGGSTERNGHPKALNELCITESEDRVEMERRTGKKFDYKLEMPYPGRRQLPEVWTVAQGMLNITSMPVTEALIRRAFSFLFTSGLQLADAAEAVDQIVEEWKKAKAEAERQQLELARAQGQIPPGETPPEGQGDGLPGGGEPSQYGERRRGTEPSGELGEGAMARTLPDAARAAAGEFEDEVGELFKQLVIDPSRIVALAMNGGSEPRT